MKEIDDKLYDRLNRIGLIPNNVRDHNVGASDYSRHLIQPWSIWLDYALSPFDADIIKRVLRDKTGEDRRTEYEKIIHICQERIRQIDAVEETLRHSEEMEHATAETLDALCALLERMSDELNTKFVKTVDAPKFEGDINNYKYIITK